MSSWAERMSAPGVAAAALALSLSTAGALAQPAPFTGIGRDATPAEVKAWDIDVRPDFKGLPAGSGRWPRARRCGRPSARSCHGVFGESNEVFNPLVGGTGKDDIETGRVASLQRNDYPGRTTLMKVATVSTLWDYINRAMPWNRPKSLSVEEVYAVTAYLLNLADVVPDDFTLSDRNIREVQQRMPNRNGMTTAHAMWPGKELGGAAQPDVAGSTCMKDCPVEPRVTSLLPPHARNTHGNLADQNRLVGAQRGAQTARRRRRQAGGAAPRRQGRRRRRHGTAAEEQLHRLPRGRPAHRRPELGRGRRPPCRQGRLPGGKDPLRRQRRVGLRPDAAAVAGRQRRRARSPTGWRPAPGPEMRARDVPNAQLDFCTLACAD